MMKRIMPFVVLAITHPAFSQPPINYSNWLSTLPELPSSNIISLSIPDDPGTPADPLIVKQFVFPLYQNVIETNASLLYYFAGKITSCSNYDIVLIYLQQNWMDITRFKQLYLITFSKEGKQLHFKKVASHNRYSDAVVDISTACLINNNLLLIEGTRTFNQQPIYIKSEHSITQHGVIVTLTKPGHHTKASTEN
ncbi:MAG: hypothetical protein RL115_562 [Bacteroidota bacterium]